MRWISDETLAAASALRADGMSWNYIAREVGLDRDVLRYRLDPAYAAHRRAKQTGPLSMIRAAPYRPSQSEIYAVLDKVPRDTRNFTARAMGDPLPGRSALDKRGVA